jgi:hypothetical protein
MTMETKQTSGTRDLVDGDEPRGRFERDDDSRAAATAASVPEAATRADEGSRRDERDAEAMRRDDTTRAGTGTLDRDDDTARRDDTPRSTSEFAATSSSSTDAASELLSRDDNAGFQGRWETIQTGFVDEPRRTVEQADELVAEVMKRLAEGFAAERERLEQQWGRGEDVSTEDLRLALQRYRSFFQRLLDV